MRFPVKRFDGLDYGDRLAALNAWYRMKDFRNWAIKARKWQWMMEAQMAHNSAILAIRDVKFWAEKAKETSNV